MARVVPNVIAENETPASSTKMNANMSYLCSEIDDVETDALQNVIEDTSPQLGGNLDVNGKTITSSDDGDISIDPNGTGTVKLGSIGQDVDVNDYDLLDIKTVSFTDEHDNGNSGTTKTIDLSEGQRQKITLTGNCTVTFSNPDVGIYTLKVIQDATGSRTLTLPSGKWVGGSAYTPTSDASAEDILSIYYDGSAYYYSVVGLDFSVPA